MSKPQPPPVTSKPRLQRIHTIYIGMLVANEPHRRSLSFEVACTRTRNCFLRQCNQIQIIDNSPVQVSSEEVGNSRVVRNSKGTIGEILEDSAR